jgi:hypothetical protein
MINRPKLKDGTEASEGMFIGNGKNIYYIERIWSPDDLVVLLSVGEYCAKNDFWHFLAARDAIVRTNGAFVADYENIPASDLPELIDLLVNFEYELEQSIKYNRSRVYITALVSAAVSIGVQLAKARTDTQEQQDE